MKSFLKLFPLCAALALSCAPKGRNGIVSMADLSPVVTPPDMAIDTSNDPTTCADASKLQSYVGCDYWPTVTFNPVWTQFDFAVVVSNPGMQMANVTVSGGALTQAKTSSVMPGQLVKIGLPWVPALKGPEVSAAGTLTAPYNVSIFSLKGAYHLVSDVPVLVYQFNALEYQGGTGMDLHGVAWSGCPGNSNLPADCFSFSNDASILLPSTAMTPNYLVTGVHGDDSMDPTTNMATPIDGPFVAITAVADSTTITMKLGPKAKILPSADGAVTAGMPGDTMTFDLDAGDVLQLMSDIGTVHDLTGSQIQATKPVQVISGHPCMINPQVNTYMLFDNMYYPNYTCDHVEETQLPFETWGKKYVVTAPSGPHGATPQYTVRIYGGAKDAKLTLDPTVSGAPSTISAGSVAEFDTTKSFYVEGDNEFSVGIIQKSGAIVDPTAIASMQEGDPSLSFMSSTEQYRTTYLFLAPNDYEENYADVVVPVIGGDGQAGTNLTLDGDQVTDTISPVGGGFGVVRIKLAFSSASGAHQLVADMPVGIQVVGYGSYTSYQYPGGLNLKPITAPPPPIN